MTYTMDSIPDPAGMTAAVTRTLCSAATVAALAATSGRVNRPIT